MDEGISFQRSLPASTVIVFSLSLLIYLLVCLFSNHLTGSECTSPRFPSSLSVFWPLRNSWPATPPSLALQVTRVAQVPPSVVSPVPPSLHRSRGNFGSVTDVPQSSPTLPVTVLAATPSNRIPLASRAMPLPLVVRRSAEVTTTFRPVPRLSWPRTAQLFLRSLPAVRS